MVIDKKGVPGKVDLKKFVYILLVLLSITAIFYLTFQSAEKTTRLSVDAQKFVLLVAEKMHIRDKLPWLENRRWIRRLAHIPEYGCLGIVMMTFVHKYNSKKIAWKYIITLLVCMSVSVLDQMIKWILPTREFDIIDLVLDGLGYSLGAGCVAGMLFIKKVYCKMVS